MTDERDSSVDPRISARYRELGAPEPPRALDEAILAAGRRGASARPASLDRAQRRRWYAPLATAAVLVLAVAVTLHMQQEKPEIAAPSAKAPAPEAPAAASEQDLKLRMESSVKPPPAPAEPRRKPAESKPESKPEAKPFAPDPAPIQAPIPAPRSDAGAVVREEDRTARDAAAAARAPAYGPLEAQGQKRAESAPAPMAAPSAAAGRATRERENLASDALASSSVTASGLELERIATLRAEGKHDEADKALAEFRKRFPDYKIPEEMLRRVERR